MTRKVIKAQVNVDYLAENFEDNYLPMKFEFLNKDIMTIEAAKEDTNNWIIYFDDEINMM